MDCTEDGTHGPGNLVVPHVTPILLSPSKIDHICSEKRRVAMKSQLTPTNVRSPILQSLVGIAACALLMSGCAGGSKLTQNERGGFYWKEVIVWFFEPTHPAI